MKINTFFNRWVFCCLFFIAALLLVRIAYSGNIRLLFLGWNLLLACIPYILSEFFKYAHNKPAWKKLLLFICWLLFFPNALYIVTDIIHLEAIPGVPLWFDALLLFTASFAGLALAFASLLNAEIFISKYLSKKYVPAAVLLLLFAGSFGVFLGRFQRWNSWDVVTTPVLLAKDIAGKLVNPAACTRSWGIVFFLMLVYSICWYFLKAFSSRLKMAV